MPHLEYNKAKIRDFDRRGRIHDAWMIKYFTELQDAAVQRGDEASALYFGARLFSITNEIKSHGGDGSIRVVE